MFCSDGNIGNVHIYWSAIFVIVVAMQGGEVGGGRKVQVKEVSYSGGYIEMEDILGGGD